MFLAAREMKREPKNERAILFAPFFARSLTLVSRSLLRGASRLSAAGRHVFGRWPKTRTTKPREKTLNFSRGSL